MNSLSRDLFARNFKVHQKRLQKVLQRRGVPEADRDDLIQDAYLKCMKKYKPEDCEFSLLRRTLVNLHIDAYRKKASQHETFEEERHTPHVEDPFSSELKKRSLVAECLDSAQYNSRAQAFYLHFSEGFAIKEIAALHHLPPGTVASKIARYKVEFSKQLQKGLQALETFDA